MRPPSAQLPRPVSDFHAQRQGPEIRLEWTAPAATTDGDKLAAPPLYALCAWPGREPPAAPPPAPLAQLAPVAEQVPSPPPPPDPARLPSGAVMPACPRLLAVTPQPAAPAQSPVRLQAAVRLRMPASPRGGGFVTLALAARNRGGASAGWSNLAVVPLTPVAPPPPLLTATATAQGVELRWQAPPAASGNVTIYRNGQPLASVSAASGRYLDRSAQWGQHYAYALVRTAGAGAAEVASAPSNTLEVTPVDRFPPPAPAGLEAVRTPDGVALSWHASPSADLAGYNIYRALAAGPWRKLNPAPVATPVYQDRAAPPGARYRVTAVDKFGNESAPSAAVTPR